MRANGGWAKAWARRQRGRHEAGLTENRGLLILNMCSLLHRLHDWVDSFCFLLLQLLGLHTFTTHIVVQWLFIQQSCVFTSFGFFFFNLIGKNPVCVLNHSTVLTGLFLLPTTFAYWSLPSSFWHLYLKKYVYCILFCILCTRPFRRSLYFLSHDSV